MTESPDINKTHDMLASLVVSLNSMRSFYLDGVKCFESIKDGYKEITNAIGGRLERINIQGFEAPQEITDANFTSTMARLRRCKNPIKVIESCKELLDVLLKTRDSLVSKHRKLSDRNKNDSGCSKDEKVATSSLLRRITEAKGVVENRIKAVVKLSLDERDQILNYLMGFTDILKTKLNKHDTPFPDGATNEKTTATLCEWLLDSNRKLVENVEEII